MVNSVYHYHGVYVYSCMYLCMYCMGDSGKTAHFYKSFRAFVPVTPNRASYTLNQFLPMTLIIPLFFTHWKKNLKIIYYPNITVHSEYSTPKNLYRNIQPNSKLSECTQSENRRNYKQVLDALTTIFISQVILKHINIYKMLQHTNDLPKPA